ncbi:MAG: DUF3040 domain-containing protein [Microbacterium sp.]
MPLSEQEQRLLDEMERHLMQNDADVVHASGARSFSYRNMVLGAVIAIAGLGAIIAGITVWQSVLAVGLVLGIVGFAAMLGGVILASTPTKTPPARGSSAHGRGAPKGSGGRGSASFMERMNDRWDRRHQGE